MCVCPTSHNCCHETRYNTPRAGRHFVGLWIHFIPLHFTSIFDSFRPHKNPLIDSLWLAGWLADWPVSNCCWFNNLLWWQLFKAGHRRDISPPQIETVNISIEDEELHFPASNTHLHKQIWCYTCEGKKGRNGKYQIQNRKLKVETGIAESREASQHRVCQSEWVERLH